MIYDDMLKWLNDQLEVAVAERRHTQSHDYEPSENLLYNLISTKIIAYETAKEHLWELNMLAEVVEEKETRKEQSLDDKEPQLITCAEAIARAHAIYDKMKKEQDEMFHKETIYWQDEETS